MSQEQWSAVDEYLNAQFLGADPVLDAVLAASAAAGLPEIQVSPAQGKLLMLMAKACRSQRILEIGTLGGYSTIWLARALPPTGRLITLEYEPKHADAARANIARTGFAAQVEIRVGRGVDSLAELHAAGGSPSTLSSSTRTSPPTQSILTGRSGSHARAR